MQHLHTPWIGEEVVGEWLPLDGRYLECPHDPQWRREQHAPVLVVTEPEASYRRTFICTVCKYEQTVRCLTPLSDTPSGSHRRPAPQSVVYAVLNRREIVAAHSQNPPDATR